MPSQPEKPVPRLVVLTGGPGAGKTAVIEIARKTLSTHVLALPEAAGILFAGGFWRRGSAAGRACAQRAIYHVQRQLERLAAEETTAPVLLCDRGTIDGLAYWPGTEAAFFREVGSSREAELARYAMVIHLRTPDEQGAYNHANPLRIETADEARAIDERILAAWDGHPNRYVLEETSLFPEKVERALALITAAVFPSDAPPPRDREPRPRPLRAPAPKGSKRKAR